MHEKPPKSGKCILLKLPAELRDRIWELQVEPGAKKVNLLDMQKQAPPKNLLLTCHKIYDEARIVHRNAHRHFWTTSIFHFPFDRDRG